MIPRTLPVLAEWTKSAEIFSRIMNPMTSLKESSSLIVWGGQLMKSFILRVGEMPLSHGVSDRKVSESML
jgi:hypothetical protein